MKRRGLAIWVVGMLLTLASVTAAAQQTPITRFSRITGNINFVATGGTLRTESNTGNACAVGTISTASLTGVPGGASIQAAYLYWGGSGSTVDSSVTLNGTAVAASRTFTATFANAGTNYPFFSAFADVTNRVSGNGSFTFAGLTVATGAPHCAVSAVAAGWSLIVIYASASERLRAINVFDGLQSFRGSALTLNPDGFRIPATGIDGRIAIFALEGDPGNSDALDGFTESLRFNGATLDDGINVAGSVPTLQPYDGTVNAQGVATSYGIDVDTFDVSSLLTPGQTSATTVFSAGGDLVLLTAQVVSATSEPVVDLSVTKTVAAPLVVGGLATYTLRVSNAAGTQREDNVVTVTDTLPAGLAFVSAIGAGWTCVAAAQVVSCSHPPILEPGQSLPDLTLVASVGPAAAPSVTNAVNVDSASFDTNASNNTATLTSPVIGPNLSTSTKTVQDLNGGEPDPGDTLRYTITLVETGGTAAVAASVTDEIPANTSGFVVGSVPPGSVDASTAAGTGANGTGRLAVNSITVPANGTVSIVFDVVIPPGTSPGALIDNTATISQPNGPGATPAAPQLIVSPSAIPGSGSKPLYLRSVPGAALSRMPPATSEANIPVNGSGTVTWTLDPALQLAVTLPAGNINVPLWLRRSGGSGASRTVRVTLANTVTGTIGSATQTITPPGGGTPALYNFVVGNPALQTFPVGSGFTLSVTQVAPTSITSITRVHPVNGAGNYSQVQLSSNTVINVDSVQAFDAAFPAGSVPGSFSPGRTVHVRAIVSDPFGSFDISAATLTLRDSTNAVQIAGQAMTAVADSGAATRSYEYTYTLPANAALGAWTAQVLATEGTEGLVTDIGVGGFTVAPLLPQLEVRKISTVLTDPVNGSALPKRIPGSVVRYEITVSNAGPGSVDASTLIVTDVLPAGVSLDVTGGGSGAVEFIDGSPASGLSFDATTGVTYSSNPGGAPPFNHVPAPDAAGFDPAIRAVRIAPTGVMAAAAPGTTSVTLRLRVRVQ